MEGGLNDATDGCDRPSDESVSNSHTHRFVRETNSSKRTKERIKCSNSKNLHSDYSLSLKALFIEFTSKFVAPWVAKPKRPI